MLEKSPTVHRSPIADRSLWYSFIRFLARTLYFKRMGGFRSVGQENVPQVGGLIVAPLHVSHLDPPAVACGTKRQLCFMAKEELFKGLFGKLIASLGSFPVKRGENDTEAIRKAIELLNSGRAVLVFPEGTRGDGVHMNQINRGVAMFASRTGAQVLPVGVVGTHIAFPKGAKKPKKHLTTIIYGEPFSYADTATGANDKENRALFAAELEKRIIELCRPYGLELKTAAEAQSPSAHPDPEKAVSGTVDAEALPPTQS